MSRTALFAIVLLILSSLPSPLGTVAAAPLEVEARLPVCITHFYGRGRLTLTNHCDRSIRVYVDMEPPMDSYKLCSSFSKFLIKGRKYMLVSDGCFFKKLYTK